MGDILLTTKSWADLSLLSSNILIGLLNHLKRHPPSWIPSDSSKVQSVDANLASAQSLKSTPSPILHPSFAPVNNSMTNNEFGYVTEPNDGYNSAGISTSVRKPRSRRIRRHLWHAALALVLERGRSISREFDFFASLIIHSHFIG